MYLCGIIKPHVFGQSEEILEALRVAGVDVIDTKILCFTPDLIDILYDHMSIEARCAITAQLSGQQGMSVLVSVRSIDSLLEIVGKESDPRLCKRGSIRARFGIHSAGIFVGEDPWWDNAFHRPIDIREAARDLLYLFKIELKTS